MWQFAGQNLRPDSPTPEQDAVYQQRQRVLLKQSAIDLTLFALTGGASYGGVRLLNRFSPSVTAIRPVRQEVSLSDLDALVAEHGAGGGHSGVALTREAALKIIHDTQPTATRVTVSGAGVQAPDLKFVSLSDGGVVDTIQVKTAINPGRFERNIREELGNSLASGEGSRVIAVMYPNAADANRLMGKLLNNFDPADTAGRSILVVDPLGRVIIPLQPWPRKP